MAKALNGKALKAFKAKAKSKVKAKAKAQGKPAVAKKPARKEVGAPPLKAKTKAQVKPAVAKKPARKEVGAPSLKAKTKAQGKPAVAKKPARKEVGAPPLKAKTKAQGKPAVAKKPARKEVGAPPLGGVPGVDLMSGLVGNVNSEVLTDGSNVYDENLKQVDASKNMNKFYKLQVIRATDGSGKFWMFNGWGRVGTKGQAKTFGPFKTQGEAVALFSQKFKAKTGVEWGKHKGGDEAAVEGKYAIQCRYFTEDANTGVRRAGSRLFQDQCFAGEGRDIHVLIFHDWAVEGNYNFDFLEKSLTRSGVGVHLHHVKRTRTMPNLDEILGDRVHNTVWIISGGKDNNSLLTDVHVRQIADFHRFGGGLALWGDNAPFYYEANLIMAELGYGAMMGNYLGSQIVGPQRGVGEPGFNERHPILHGIDQLFEGITVAGLPEDLLSRGWIELMRATDRRLLTAFLPPKGKHGPCVLHGAFTQLFYNLTAAGQEPFVLNLGTYTVLRDTDTDEGQAESSKVEYSIGQLVQRRDKERSLATGLF